MASHMHMFPYAAPCCACLPTPQAAPPGGSTLRPTPHSVWPTGSHQTSWRLAWPQLGGQGGVSRGRCWCPRRTSERPHGSKVGRAVACCAWDTGNGVVCGRLLRLLCCAWTTGNGGACSCLLRLLCRAWEVWRAGAGTWLAGGRAVRARCAGSVVCLPPPCTHSHTHTHTHAHAHTQKKQTVHAELSDICHQAGVPLIVDEAHGGHFGLHPAFPPSALQQGADISIQSTHKVSDVVLYMCVIVCTCLDSVCKYA